MTEDTTVQREIPAEGADELLLAGVNDEHLKTLSRLADLRVILRRDKLILSGSQDAVEKSMPVARRMVRLARLQRSFDANDVERTSSRAPARTSPRAPSRRFPRRCPEPAGSSGPSLRGSAVT